MTTSRPSASLLALPSRSQTAATGHQLTELNRAKSQRRVGGTLVCFPCAGKKDRFRTIPLVGSRTTEDFLCFALTPHGPVILFGHYMQLEGL